MLVRCLFLSRVAVALWLAGLTAPCFSLSHGSMVRFARFAEFAPAQPLMFSCSAEPRSVHPGDVINVSGSTTGLNPKRKAVYTWTGTGGRISPAGANATVDTSGLAPGAYSVTSHLAQGDRSTEQATCTAEFTVKPFEPPGITCTATPSSADPGTTIDIGTLGTSPQNRPLSYSYKTTAGRLSSNGPTARLSTTGLGPGPVTVTCNAVDDLGQAASTTTRVDIKAPAMAHTQQLCSVSFTRDKQHPVRVDKESESCLDDVALALSQHSGAKLVIVGNASPDEKPEAAAERALNVRQYLMVERRIGISRIDVRTGATSGRTADNILLPSGAVPDDQQAHAFDESSIQRHGQPYAVPDRYRAHPKVAQ